MSNIFSPNYSVGTVLCTLQCPGSGMAWWVMAGAKLRPPLIVLSLDFPYSLVSMCGTSALPLPSWPGRLTAQCRGWCGVSSTGCLNSQTPSVWTCLFLISAILVLIQSRWKIPQLCTNLSSCEVSDLLLPPADASCVAPLLWFLSWMPGASCAAAARLRVWLERAGERGIAARPMKPCQTPTERKQLLVLLVLLVRSETCFAALIFFLPRKPVVDTRMSAMLTSIFFPSFYCFMQAGALGEHLHYFKSSLQGLQRI